MSVLPRTQLGYTLGIRRDKDIYGQGERIQKNPFAESRGRTRMAGDRRVDIFTAERDYLRAPTVRGDYLPNRFVSSVPVSRMEQSDG
jgi:hypothetical protein